MTFNMNRMDDPVVLDGDYHVVFFPSGYNGSPYRAHVCRFDGRRAEAGFCSWTTTGGDNVSDDGSDDPVGWLPVPELPSLSADEQAYENYLVACNQSNIFADAYEFKMWLLKGKPLGPFDRIG